jgi:hypothetical protein
MRICHKIEKWMCAVAIGSFDSLLRAGPWFSKAARVIGQGLHCDCKFVCAKTTANGDIMFETHNRFIKGADLAKKARRRTNMHCAISAIFQTIRCVSGGIEKSAIFKTELANDSERTRVVLYTFHCIPPASSILYTLRGSLCPCKSVTPKPFLWPELWVSRVLTSHII